MQSSEMDIIGKEVDGYLIQSVLGRGGMGVVFQAEDVALSRRVALKMIDPSLAGDETFLRRFRAEARALARVDSQHIVQVYALRQIDSNVFIVMECVEGGTLGDRISKGPIPWPEALALFRQMLLAFENAHGVGVIHRDIKPGNIMLTPESTVKVTDFGLAKFYKQDAEATRTQGISGTLSYMPPEQMKGEAMDARTDLWSLGVVLYEMLTGRKPFEGESEVARMHAVLNRPPAPISPKDQEVPRPLVELIEQLLQKDPARRPQSAAEVRAGVDRLIRHNEAGEPVPERRSYRPIAIASVAILVVLLGAGIYSWFGPSEQVSSVPTGANLFLSTHPSGAYVYVRDRAVGRAPIESLAIEEGPVPLRVRLDGYRMLDTTIVAVSGERITLSFDLVPEQAESIAESRRAAAEDVRNSQQAERSRPPQGGSSEPPGGSSQPPAPATVAVRAVPGGDVEVDGRRIGETGSIEAGRRTISCSREGARVDTVLTVGAGAHVDLTCYFEAVVNVQVLDADGRPSWGTVLINGESTDEFGGSFRLQSGSYRFMVRREGYTTLDEEKQLVIRPSFQETTHRLVFRIQAGRG